jgi:hypothetical protein
MRDLKALPNTPADRFGVGDHLVPVAPKKLPLLGTEKN